MARWSAKDDEYLWDNRDDPVQTLADKFSRTRTSIRNRLENLRQPTHAAYTRLFGDNFTINDYSHKTIKRRPIAIDDKSSNSDNSDNNDTNNNSNNSKKKKKNKWRKKQSGKKWSVKDDIYLWIYRDDSVHILAKTFQRTKTSIKCRLENLRDTNSKWRKRLLLALPKDNNNNKHENNSTISIDSRTSNNAIANTDNNMSNNNSHSNNSNPLQPQNIQPGPYLNLPIIQPQAWPQPITAMNYDPNAPMNYQIPHFNTNNTMYPMYSMSHPMQPQYTYNNTYNNTYDAYNPLPMPQYTYTSKLNTYDAFNIAPIHNNYNVQSPYIANYNNINSDNILKRPFDGNYGMNEPVKKRQRTDDTLIIPSHVIQRAEQFKKIENETINNVYCIGQHIQILDIASSLWINATVMDKQNNWIVVHFDGCESIYDQKIHVVKNKDKIRNIKANPIEYHLTQAEYFLQRQQKPSNTTVNTQNEENKKNEENKNEIDEEVPDEFCDPITFETMKEPTLVIVSGVTYEKSVIEEYIKENGKDPMTRQAVTIDQLVPNRALRDTIERWRKNHPGVD